jgi:hypothetical protein
MEPLGSAELLADDRELAQRRVEDLLLERAIPLQDEPEDRRGDRSRGKIATKA